MKQPLSYQPITVEQLQAAADASDRPLLLDVRPEADYQTAHIPTAIHNCVYEIGFIARMEAVAAMDGDRSICVYGHCPDSHDARMAAEKLVRAGYRNVLELCGGMEEWRAKGGGIEGDGAPPPPDPVIADGRRDIDLAESRVEWIGRNLLNRHHGTLGLRAGHLEFHDGLPTGGEFLFDMNAIVCTNLAGDPLHDILVDHLRSHDFFDTELYPEANYRILSTRRIEGAGAGAPNLRIEGELTLKGRTLPLAFDAVAGLTPEGRSAAQAVLAFDRTHWNVVYGSARFFHNLGMHLVNDLIEVHLRILTK